MHATKSSIRVIICRLTVSMNVQAEIDPLGKNKKT